MLNRINELCWAHIVDLSRRVYMFWRQITRRLLHTKMNGIQKTTRAHIDSLVQHKSNSTANALVFLQYCSRQMIYLLCNITSAYGTRGCYTSNDDLNTHSCYMNNDMAWVIHSHLCLEHSALSKCNLNMHHCEYDLYRYQQGYPKGHAMLICKVMKLFELKSMA